MLLINQNKTRKYNKKIPVISFKPSWLQDLTQKQTEIIQLWQKVTNTHSIFLQNYTICW